MAEQDLSKHSVAELKEMLRNQGLPVSGRKADLIARLSDLSGQTDSAHGGISSLENAVSMEDDEVLAQPISFQQRSANASIRTFQCGRTYRNWNGSHYGYCSHLCVQTCMVGL